MNKAGDFVLALVVYTMRCIEDGETERLVRMGFGAAEIEELAALRLGDVQRMGRLESHGLDIRVDRRAFADMIRRIRSDGNAQEWEHRLIRADAPLDMMRSLFGTGSREYTRLRQLYDVCSTGRPREVTEDQEARLWPVPLRRTATSSRPMATVAWVRRFARLGSSSTAGRCAGGVPGFRTLDEGVGAGSVGNSGVIPAARPSWLPIGGARLERREWARREWRNGLWRPRLRGPRRSGRNRWQGRLGRPGLRRPGREWIGKQPADAALPPATSRVSSGLSGLMSVCS